MSRTITYRCDKCGSESTEAKNLDLKLVAVGIKEDQYSSFSGQTFTLQDGEKRQKEMCQACRRALGIDYVEKPKTANPPSYPTLEDMIREIVREEIG